MQRLRTLLVLATALIIAPACTTPMTPDLLPPSAMEVVGGDQQTAAAGSELPMQLVARVTDANGKGLEGVSILWIGDGEAWAQATRTAPDGIARNYWTLGPDVGTQLLEVWTYDVEKQERGILLNTFMATSTHP